MSNSTKVLICIVGVLANASIWGDASIDSLITPGVGFTDVKASDGKGCSRLCKFGQKPKRCVYDFVIRNQFVNNQTVLSINGKVPGPLIEVCQNDIVDVNVINRLQGAEVAFHWRGISQRGTPFMDGVPMVTQCPITSGTSFRYSFRADEIGTHFYHAHTVSQQLHGLYGPIVVRQPSQLEQSSSLYDYDRLEDLIVVSADTSSFASTSPTRLSINAEQKRIFVSEGSKYRIRVINAIPVDCPLTFEIEQHALEIISSDGRPVKPTRVKSFLLYPGERIDFVLDAIRPASTYKIHISGQAACDRLTQTGFVTYENLNVTYASDNSLERLDTIETVSGQYLKALTSPPAHLTVSPSAEKTVYMQIDSNYIKVNDDDNEYRYLSDAMPVPAFYPAELTEYRKVVQINGKSFMYPNSPLLTQPNDVIKRTLCQVGYEHKSKYVECVHVLNVDYKSTLELILIDEGVGSDVNKTFAIHGNPMYVLSTSDSAEKPIRVSDVRRADNNGEIKRNLFDPPRKDTIVVPNKGYVVVRIVADNPGAWLLECRSCSLSSLPTAIIINVQTKLSDKLLDTLPKCGNFKRPDTLLT